MSGTNWTNTAGGNFTTAGNWSAGAPGAASNATIAAPGTYAVTLATADSLSSLLISDAGASVLDTGTLALTNTLGLTAGQFTLSAGGEIAGGTLSATGGSFDWAGGALSNSVYQGVLSLTGTGESLSIANGLTVTGAGGIGTINATGGASALAFIGTQTLNSVLVELGNAAGGSTGLSFDTLTLGANTTVEQLGGNTLVPSWSVESGSTLINDGTITAGAYNAGADILVTSLVNAGVIAATSPYGGYSIQATDYTNSGTLNAGGGVGITVSDSLVNTGLISDTGGVAVSAPNLVNDGQIVLSGYNDYFAFEGGINGSAVETVSGNGTIALTGSLNQLRFLGDENITQGTILLSGTTEQLTSSQPYPLTTASLLTFGSQVVVEQTAGSAQISGGGYAGSEMLNLGLISAQGFGGTLSLSDSNLVNDGFFAASNGGSLVVQSALTGTGALDISTGGQVELLSASAGQSVNFLDTSAATLKLDSPSAFAGTINNFGTGNVIDLSTTSYFGGVSATAASWSGGTLDVTLAGGSTVALAMAGNYSTATFGTKSDGGLGTDITLASGGNTGGGLTTRTYGGSGAALSVTEDSPVNAVVGTFTDSVSADTASQFTALITWGDGTSGTGTVTGSNGVFSVSAAGHSYADEGNYATSINILNSADHSSVLLSGSAVAGEADMFTAGAPVTFSASTGTIYSGTVGTFTDSNTAGTPADLAATINWGDGTSSAGTLSEVNGTISVAGSHAYAAPGSDAVSVTLQDTKGTASATSVGTATVTTPVYSNGDGAVSVLSVSETGVGQINVLPANLNSNSNTASGSGITAVTASSASTATWAPAAAAMGAGQTVAAAWTSNLTGTATFNDNWSSSTTGAINSWENFGLGQNTPGYSNASFTFTMATAGTFDITWNATESGTDTFGFLNMVAVVDGGTPMQVSPVNATVATPTGDFSGTLAAGVHTITLEDWSNYTGDMGNTSGTFSETLNLAITPSGGTGSRTYGGTAGTLSGTEGHTAASTLASFTDSTAADSASQFSALITWGDGTTSMGTVSGANGSFAVTSAGHDYTDEGSFATSIAITNSADNSGILLSGTALIAEADTLTAGAPLTLAATTGTMVTGTIATFTDSYTGNTAGDFSALIAWGDGTTSAGVVTDVNGTIAVTGSHSYSTSGTDTLSVSLTEDNGGASATAAGKAIVTAGWTDYTLADGTDTFTTGPGPNLIFASASAISSVNALEAVGTTVLSLTGTGLFDLTAAATLSGVSVVDAQEGAGQTIDLRGGTSMAINVLSGTTSTAAITIKGATNHDKITLGKGVDTVYLGAGETLVGGGGKAIVHINAASAADSIGGTGATTLVVDGGGKVTLGKGITNASAVTLSQTTTFTANSLTTLKITGSAAGHDTIVLGAAGQSVVGGGISEHITALAAYGGDAITGVGTGSVLDITSTGHVTLNAADTVAQVRLDQVGTLTLNHASFVTATGLVQGDTLVAMVAGQTLSSAAGGDTLVGATAGSNLFTGTATGMARDLIGSFLATDKIDITNLAYAGATLKTAAAGANTALTVTSGGVSSSFTLAGSFSLSSFHLGADSGSGLLISLG